MARRIDIYLCTACEGVAPQWVGRCPHCGQWNTLTVTRRGTDSGSALGSASPSRAVAVSLRHVDGCEAQPMATGVVEVDRVLGGGFVAGSVTLVFGPPGVGKSTLLFQVLASVAGGGAEVLLASAEESLTQVSGRATRIGAVPENLLALAGNDVVAIERAIVHHHPALVVVDSIQTVSDDERPGAWSRSGRAWTG
jgi:DNA repair protein RadA/Sms